MATKDICRFKDYLKCEDDKLHSKTRKKLNKKGKKGRPTSVYGWAGYGPPPNLSGNGSGNGGNGGGMGESFMYDTLTQRHVPSSFRKYKDLDWYEYYDKYYNSETDEEDDEYSWFSDPDFDEPEIEVIDYEEDVEDVSKKDQARGLYRSMRGGDLSRKDIIAQFQSRLGLTPSSATAYYERIAREFGETEQQAPPGGPPPGGMPAPGMEAGMGMPGMGMMPGGTATGPEGMMDTEEPPEKKPWKYPDRQGVIRRVKGAHLVYKRQQDDGSFEELWVYKQGDKFKDELNLRRDILAGTDIPVEKTMSQDRSQKAETWASGNVQFLNITGLPNQC